MYKFYIVLLWYTPQISTMRDSKDPKNLKVSMNESKPGNWYFCRPWAWLTQWGEGTMCSIDRYNMVQLLIRGLWILSQNLFSTDILEAQILGPKPWLNDDLNFTSFIWWRAWVAYAFTGRNICTYPQVIKKKIFRTSMKTWINNILVCCYPPPLSYNGPFESGDPYFLWIFSHLICTTFIWKWYSKQLL